MHPAERTAHLSSSELAALRRKKNADAQAAFRKRRANYIATLEETVNNLEQVVRSLQETIHDAKMTEHDLKTENSRLRFELEAARKSQQSHQPAAPQWQDSAPWASSGVGFRPPSEASSLPQYAGTPSATPPLSTTHGSPSPPGGTMSSASTSASAGTPYRMTPVQTASVEAVDDGPVNMLSRPVFRAGPDVKPFPAGPDGLYTFQQRPQDVGGWVDSPVDSPSVVTHNQPFIFPDQQPQSRPLYTGNAPKYNTEPMTPVVPLAVAVDDDQHRRRSVHSSASASPTTTSPASPFSPRGPPAMFAAPQQVQGMDTGAAFRSYFNHATAAAVPTAGPSSAAPIGGYSQEHPEDMEDDDYERGGDDGQPLSDTLAVLKAYAFGGVRKSRTRNSRSRGED